jgi:hypothetical protein
LAKLEQAYRDAIHHKQRMKAHWEATKRFWRMVEAFVTCGRVHRPCGKAAGHEEPRLISHLAHSTTLGCYSERDLCPGCLDNCGTKTVAVRRVRGPRLLSFEVSPMGGFFSAGACIDHESLLAALVCDRCSERVRGAVPDTAGTLILLRVRLGFGVEQVVTLVASYILSLVARPVCFRCQDV